ncbi:unannotated protein [freshwater metagenome]|uniref:Unannotated protein n=1 Tax=freshwater metagenome TaxID=449393 RepID=A0A6J7E4E1_9ZZZZ|nr:hypothetical protein [Actinomycetota bacterium]
MVPFLMIAFASAITQPDVFDTCAAPGIRRASEPGAEVLEIASRGTLFSAYNQALDWARGLDDLEALVLLHQDTEIVEEDFCAKVRAALADPDVAIVGCVGAVGVRSIAWWESSIVTASFVHRYHEFGGGDLPSMTWDWAFAPGYARLGEVETVDGFLLVLSPWALANLRFDESLGQIHGYDLDLCLQARAAGRKVVTADLRAIHHRSLELIRDLDEWAQASVRVTRKWEERFPQIGAGMGTWRDRALRAEADADAAMLFAHLRRRRGDAHAGAVRRRAARVGRRLASPRRRPAAEQE